ncbi:MAG: peptidyl-prolyl cis-trans isomerase [Acidobacteriia bacterium]|nr:peptidyl-prolyl cis-trans isomerase [Terriglobia bacterium]
MIRFLQTPGKTKKIVLGGLLMVICGAMVITLIPGGILGDTFGFGNPQGNVIAKVGDQEVTVSEVQDSARQMGKQQFPRGFPQQFMPFLMQRAAQQLIVQKAMVAEAHRMGFKVTDAELQSELQHGTFASALFPGGNFVGQNIYEGFIQQNFNMGVPQFEQLLMTDLLIRKLRAAVEGGVTVSDQEIAQQYQRENTKVKFDYAVLTLEDLMKQVQPSEAELKSYFDQHKQQYANAIPEKRQARYIVIDTGKVRQQVQVTPQELQQYYNSHRDQYRVPEQVNVRHILIKTPAPGPDGKVDEAAMKAAREKADSVLKQVQAGGNFAELAKKYSEDAGSKDNGGSIGWIQRGQTVPEFEQSAFSLPKGQTSGIVRSTFGFHIIHVDDKQEAHVKSLDEVKPQIEPQLAADKAATRADALASKVQTDARTAGLDKAAKNSGLDVVETGLFTRTDSLPGLGNAPEFMSAALSARDKGTPDTVHIPQGYVVYQVTKVELARTPSFEEIRSRVEQEFKADAANRMLQQKTAELSEKARSLHDLKKAAKELGATVKTSDLVGPSSQVPDLGSLSGPASIVFDMKSGEISAPIGTGRSGVVVALLDKQEPPPAQFAASKDRLRDQLLQKKRNEFLEVFASNLQKRMEKDGKIKINQQELKRITTPTQSSEGS